MLIINSTFLKTIKFLYFNTDIADVSFTLHLNSRVDHRNIQSTRQSWTCYKSVSIFNLCVAQPVHQSSIKTGDWDESGSSCFDFSGPDSILVTFLKSISENCSASVYSHCCNSVHDRVSSIKINDN